MGATTGRRRVPHLIHYLLTINLFHGTVTEYKLKISIYSMGSKSGTKNQTTDDIQISRNLRRNKVSPSVRPQTLGNRVGRNIS